MHVSRPLRQQLIRLRTRAEQAGMSEEVLDRLEWFLDFVQHGSVSKTCRRFRIARTTFYRWARRFDASDPRTLEDESTMKSRHSVCPLRLCES